MFQKLRNILLKKEDAKKEKEEFVKNVLEVKRVSDGVISLKLEMKG